MELKSFTWIEQLTINASKEAAWYDHVDRSLEFDANTNLAHDKNLTKIEMAITPDDSY